MSWGAYRSRLPLQMLPRERVGGMGGKERGTALGKTINQRVPVGEDRDVVRASKMMLRQPGQTRSIEG